MLQPRHVFKKSSAAELNKPEAESGILIVKLLHLFIGNLQQFATLSAFERLRPRLIRR